jgi:translation initiation factor IF-3
VRPGDERRGPRTQTRINEQIRAKQVRVIDPDNAQLGIMPVFEALRIAQEKGLDLVEVQANADPPVCRIMDYGRQQYEQSRRDREARKNQRTKEIQVKEVRVRPKTDPHDLETKLRAITKWLEEGDKVQLTLRMRGREQAHPDWGRKVLTEMASKVGDVGRIERDVLSEGRQMTLVLAPSAVPAKRPARPPAPPPAEPPRSASPEPAE